MDVSMSIQNLYHSDRPSYWIRFFPPFLVSLICVVIYFYTNFLVFHVLAELFSIFIGLTAMTVAMTSARFTQNQFVIFLSLSAGWFSCLDIAHVLVYKGMGLLVCEGGNESTQFWICARFLQAFCILISPYFLKHSLKIWIMNLCFAGAILSVFILVFKNQLPTTYIDYYGVTFFKTVSEWLIIIILLFGFLALWYHRAIMAPLLFMYLSLFIGGMILSELLLSQYTSLFGWQNILGHILKIFYYWFIYIALVINTLTKPFNLLARTANSYNHIPDPVLVIEENGVISQANHAAGIYSHLNPMQLIGLSAHTIFHNKEEDPRECPICSQLQIQQEPYTVELHLNERWVECALTPVDSDFFPNSWVQIIRDITARKLLEKERTQTLFNLNERVKELRCLNTLSTLIATKNTTIEQLLSETVKILPDAFQYPEKIVVSIVSDWGAFYSNPQMNPGNYVLSKELVIQEKKTGVIKACFTSEPPDINNPFLFEEDGLLDAVSILISQAISHLLAEKKADVAEHRFQESERHFKAILEQTGVGVYVRSDEKFLYVNPRFCQILGFESTELLTMGLMELVDNEQTKAFIQSQWEKLKNGEPGVTYNIPVKRKDGIEILLRIDATMMTWNGDLETIAFIQDVTEVEQAKIEIDKHVRELEHAIKGIFKAVSTMIELRDPYTAGHEHRVGLIAKAIGAELGWPKERCEYLELIGLVHDIGKISIPAEILSKPTALNQFEIEMIKKHPESGYDILKHIHFKFPVAEVILQHHERLDGSGYPRGLKGEQILPETRIISVADVFEAMSAHRPYRPSLGIDFALDELRRGRGIQYDADVVDAAIKVIQSNQLNLFN